MNNRPGWDEYFMEMAVLTARRSTCLRRNVGAVIVKDRHIVATGYNGAPRGLEHCGDRKGGSEHRRCRYLHNSSAVRNMREDDNKCRNKQDSCKGRLSG